MLKNYLSAIKPKHWLSFLFLSIAISYFVVARIFANDFNYLSLRYLKYLPILLIPVFFAVAGSYVLSRKWQPLITSGRYTIISSAVIACVVLCIILQPPVPAFNSQHQLIISTTGNRNPYSQGQQVEIEKIRTLSGAGIQTDTVSMSSDWVVQDGVYFNQGTGNSQLVIAGMMPGGLVLNLKYSDTAGIIQIDWDGVVKDIDLYTHKNHVIYALPIYPEIGNIPFITLLAMIFCMGLYILGLFSLLMGIFVILFLIQAKLSVNRPAVKIVYPTLLLIIALSYAVIKFSYISFDEGRAFNDTAGYINTAVQPMNSLQFWFGERPFTYPLLLKMLAITPDNYYRAPQLQSVGQAQIMLSILAWILFAWTLSKLSMRPALKAVIFTLILIFSLSIEVSVWDTLLLSESLSISLMVVIFSFWILLLRSVAKDRITPLQIVSMLSIFLLSMLYIFTRDTNLIFLITCAGALCLCSFLFKNRKLVRIFSLTYLVFLLMCVIFQTVSFSNANRWQIFIHDHLALRILRDADASQYFIQEGMPVSSNLFSIAEMESSQYQVIFENDAEYAPLREWIDCCSLKTYLKYLVSNPVKTISMPFIEYQKLLNGTNIEYRYPRDGVWPVSQTVTRLSIMMYTHNQGVSVLFFLLCIAGIIFLKRKGDPVWIFPAVLILSIVPMMLVVWHAEPMEIERHANQIGIVLRLTGWIGFLVILDEITGRIIAKSGKNNRESGNQALPEI